MHVPCISSPQPHPHFVLNRGRASERPARGGVCKSFDLSGPALWDPAYPRELQVGASALRGRGNGDLEGMDAGLTAGLRCCHESRLLVQTSHIGCDGSVSWRFLDFGSL